ncbi:glycosyl transferase family 1 [Hyphomicrobium sp. MC8b]|uniref:glycosyl transferase family 1 n=1 Tax=Hyphomicrobium sp. MC8b TaxID=300273 RepID=UPI00391C7809
MQKISATAPVEFIPPREENPILASFSEYDAHVRFAEKLYGEGRFAAAALESAVAASVAAHRHCGIFASPRIEGVLTSIGRSIGDGKKDAEIAPRPNRIKSVLHVATQLAPVGGLTRMISRWVNADKSRTNSLVLTQHRGPIPDHTNEAFHSSGGQIFKLNHSPGGKLEWALALRNLARKFDAVVLHFHCEDVVPIIAFANPETMPPVILLNHADHIFWLGPSISQVVVSLREAAADIAIGRRGVEPRRSIVMPTIVDPTVREKSRQDAKKILGIDSDCVLILSVARGVKYRTIGGVTFADRHAKVLAENPKAKLLVIGVGNPDDWEPVKQVYPGRLETLPEIELPRAYFEAADVYVDSYPFVSSTSMMEAAGYGLPLLTIFDAPKEARIFAINHVGLDGTAVVATTQSDYEEKLTRLIQDEPYRRKVAEASHDAVESQHTPPGWLAFLEAVYQRAIDLPLPDPQTFIRRDDLETPQLGEPDRRHHDIVGSTFSTANITKGFMGMLPLRERYTLWRRLQRQGHYGSNLSLKSFIPLVAPEWMKRCVLDR